MARVLLA